MDCSQRMTQGSRVYFTNSRDCCSILEKLDFSRSVSYTHLDVYKRQQQGIQRRGQSRHDVLNNRGDVRHHGLEGIHHVVAQQLQDVYKRQIRERYGVIRPVKRRGLIEQVLGFVPVVGCLLYTSRCV